MILDELSMELDSVLLSDFTSLASTLIFKPLTFESVSIRVVHHSSHLSRVIFHVAFVELPVGEEDFDDAILQFPAIKTSFNDLIWRAEEDALTLRFSLTPLTLVNGAICELTDSRPVSMTILPVSLVNVATGKNHLSLPMLLAL